MTAADSLQVGGSATPGPGARRGTRNLVSPRLWGPTPLASRISRMSAGFWSHVSLPAPSPRSGSNPPAALFVSATGGSHWPLIRASLGGAGRLGPHRLPSAFVPPRLPAWCFPSSRGYSIFEPPRVRTPSSLSQVPATSAPPGSVSSSSRLRLL